MPHNRSANYHEREKYFLVELLMRYPHAISRKRDVQSCQAKNFAWGQVTVEFNANIGSPRMVHSLKDLWKNMKNMARKEMVGMQSPEAQSMENNDCVLEVTPADVLAVLNKRSEGSMPQWSDISANSPQWKSGNLVDEVFERRHYLEHHENSCGGSTVPRIVSETMDDRCIQSHRKFGHGAGSEEASFRGSLNAHSGVDGNNLLDNGAKISDSPIRITSAGGSYIKCRTLCDAESPSTSCQTSQGTSAKSGCHCSFRRPPRAESSWASISDGGPSESKVLRLDGHNVEDREMIETTTLNSPCTSVSSQSKAQPSVRDGSPTLVRSAAYKTKSRGSQPDIVAYHNSSAMPENPSATKKTWKCEPCGIIFPDNIMFGLHKGCHTTQQPFKCNICGKVCSDKHDFTFHITVGGHDTAVS